MQEAAPKRGRKASHDWDDLFRDWATSGQTKAVFLAARGLSIRTGNVQRATRGWDLKLDELSRATVATVAEQFGERTAEVPKDLALPPQESEPEHGEACEAPSSWGTIRQWRRGQAVRDYQSASVVRAHLEATLSAAETAVLVDGAREVVETRLTPQELRNIVMALEGIQRIQRLALGLSTENIGVDTPSPTESHIAKQRPPEETPIPTFIVEMANGKFLRPRPRRVN